MTVLSIVLYLSQQTLINRHNFLRLRSCSLAPGQGSDSVFAIFQHVERPDHHHSHLEKGPTPTSTHLSLRDLTILSLAKFGTGRMAFHGPEGRARFSVTIIKKKVF